jgi:carboxylate-amine ligase
VADRGAKQEALTLGVEEELHLVDLSTRRLTPRAGEVLAGLSASARTYTDELQQTTVETNTEVVSDLAALRRSLVGLRAELVAVADKLGIGVASAGTMPLCPREVPITENARYRRMRAEYQLLAREQFICGMHVHVGIADRDVAAALLDRVSPWLPPLLALSVSSPFSFTGDDSGYASTRTVIFTRWPTTGGAGPLASAAEYDALVRDLVATGVISDPAMIYFDVRPSAHVPTIEVRVCDACPSVDTVVLVAGLFRAVVRRELDRYAAGEPSTAVALPLQRSAMWRAARSGLEGELVDPGAPRAVPAGVRIRGMVDELRPELEAHGDWEIVRALAEAALAGGSAAAWQREAFRRTRRIEDVVDLVMAVTRGEAVERGSAVSSSPLRGYVASGFDEAILPDGRARPAHAAMLDALCAMGPAALGDRQAVLDRETAAAGVVFRPRGAPAPAALPLHLVPRILTGEEWSRVQGGTAQRARALDAFVRDVYGDAEIVRDGVVPGWLVDHAPGRRAAGSAPPRGARRVHVAGFDLVRDGDGRWLVLEDNVRVPSGVAFAIETRRLTRVTLPDLVPASALLDPEDAPALLRSTLEQCTPERLGRGEPRLALLSDGPGDPAFFEHRLLAEAMGIPLVTPRDLVVDDDVVWHVADGERRRIDVVYMRFEDQLARRAGAGGRPLGPDLEHATRAGTVTLANAPGNGIADDKAIYAYVPRFIEYYLGEVPLLEQVPTYHCADPGERAHVLSRLDELVIKPVDGYGGSGVVIGPRATPRDRGDARVRIEREPGRWIAQELVALSTHPTLERSGLRPRHVDLRVFVYYGRAPVVVPAPLTRVAPPGSMLVNSASGGGAKDTWLFG